MMALILVLLSFVTGALVLFVSNNNIGDKLLTLFMFATSVVWFGVYFSERR